MQTPLVAVDCPAPADFGFCVPEPKLSKIGRSNERGIFHRPSDPIAGAPEIGDPPWEGGSVGAARAFLGSGVEAAQVPLKSCALKLLELVLKEPQKGHHQEWVSFRTHPG